MSSRSVCICPTCTCAYALRPTGIKLLSADDFETWFFSIEVLGDSLYQVCLSWHLHSVVHLTWQQGELFKLMFRFDASYPISAPAVQFVVDHTTQAPIHPVSVHHSCSSVALRSYPAQHIYSNGHVSVIKGVIPDPELFRSVLLSSEQSGPRS